LKFKEAIYDWQPQGWSIAVDGLLWKAGVGFSAHRCV
jgi:hypothetical protein